MFWTKKKDNLYDHGCIDDIFHCEIFSKAIFVKGPKLFLKVD